MAHTLKNPLAMQDPRVLSRVGKIPWRREWHPTPVFLPGESHGRRSLAGCSPWGCKESDTTERLTLFTVPLLLARRWWWVVMNCPLKQECQNIHSQIPTVPDTQLTVDSETHGEGVGQSSHWPPLFALTSDGPARTGAVKFPKLRAGDEGPPCKQQSFTV